MGNAHGATVLGVEDLRASGPLFPPGATVEWKETVSRQQAAQCAFQTNPGALAAELARLRRLLGMAAQVIHDANMPHDAAFVNALREAAGLPLLSVPCEDHAPNNMAPRPLQDGVKGARQRA